MKPECRDCRDEYERRGTEPKKARPLVARSGGRCASHWRQEKRRRSDAAHQNRIEKVYGLRDGRTGALYQFQDGRCFICQRANGVAGSELSVDCDQKTRYVRGLICRACGAMLERFRNDSTPLRRAIQYLHSPPAWKAIGRVRGEDM